MYTNLYYIHSLNINYSASFMLKAILLFSSSTLKILAFISSPIGYGQVILNRGKYTIVNLGVIKEHRGMRYGEELLKYLINLCICKNISEIYIRVDKNNIPALRLYTKLGFREYSSYSVWNS